MSTNETHKHHLTVDLGTECGVCSSVCIDVGSSGMFYFSFLEHSIVHQDTKIMPRHSSRSGSGTVLLAFFVAKAFSAFLYALHGRSVLMYSLARYELQMQFWRC